MNNTKRIFDNAPMQGEIETEILETRPVKEGLLVSLSKTIFFPRGGGQPCEAGMLGEQAVLDVYEENGIIWHLVKELPRQNPLMCRIDLAQRHEHMQQHTAQHIFSAVVDQLFGIPTLIARIEQESAHIEFAAPLTEEQLLKAMEKTEEVLRAALPIRCTYHTPEEAATMPVRGKITPHESIRLVTIEGFDCNACGGTHCTDTAEAGPIRLIGSKNVRGAYRLYFVAGERAIRYAKQADLRTLRLGELTECETAQAAEEKIFWQHRRLTELEEEHRELKERFLAAEEELLLARAEHCENSLFILCHTQERETKELKALCDRLTLEHPALAAISCRQGENLTLILAQQKNLTAVDLGKELKSFLSEHGGKGGGSKIMAQGVLAFSQTVQQEFEKIAKKLAMELCKKIVNKSKIRLVSSLEMTIMKGASKMASKRDRSRKAAVSFCYSSKSFTGEISSASQRRNKVLREIPFNRLPLFASIWLRNDQLMPTSSANCSWVNPRSLR